MWRSTSQLGATASPTRTSNTLWAHSVIWVELGDDPPRHLLAGPDRAGNLLELVVLVLGGDELVIHAMPLRRSTAQELFGDE